VPGREGRPRDALLQVRRPILPLQRRRRCAASPAPPFCARLFFSPVSELLLLLLFDRRGSPTCTVWLYATTSRYGSTAPTSAPAGHRPV
jgi:hypothetical protein